MGGTGFSLEVGPRWVRVLQEGLGKWQRETQGKATKELKTRMHTLCPFSEIKSICLYYSPLPSFASVRDNKAVPSVIPFLFCINLLCLRLSNGEISEA